MLARVCLSGRLFENGSERLDRKSPVGDFDRHRHIVEVNFVDDTTIYSLKVANIREELHESIVHNHPPAGGWVERGANGAMNIRVVIPYLVAIVAVLIKFVAIV
jgi:hypothetical protein